MSAPAKKKAKASESPKEVPPAAGRADTKKGAVPAANETAPSFDSFTNPELQGFLEQVWYQPGGKKDSCIFPDGRGELFTWSEKDFRLKLRSMGIPDKKALGELTSPVDKVLARLQAERSVQAAIVLAGYQKGERTVNGLRVLVKRGPNLPEPAKGSCETVLRFIRQLLGESHSGQPNQDPEAENQFHAWAFTMARGIQAVREERAALMKQIQFLIGDTSCGKTLFQEVIITELLGGRSFKMNDYVTGEERFSGSQFGYEHVYVSDAQGGGDKYEKRMIQQKRLKEMVTGENHTCRAMFTDGLTLSPVWFITYSGNVDKMNELPPWDDDFSDKAHLFRCRKAWWPDDGKEFKEWLATLRREIPALAFYLREKSGGGRFGVRAYHHPELLRNLHQFSVEERLRDLINNLIFSDGLEQVRTFAGHEELRKALREKAVSRGQERDVESAVSGGNWLGRRLNELAKRHPSEFISRHTAKGTEWTIRKAE